MEVSDLRHSGKSEDTGALSVEGSQRGFPSISVGSKGEAAGPMSPWSRPIGYTLVKQEIVAFMIFHSVILFCLLKPY